MEIHQAIILGLVQGLTEFLPISSSGHLVLVQHFFGLHEAEVVFDIGLHLGTLIAVLFYFRQDLASMVSALVDAMTKGLKKEITAAKAFENPDIRLAGLIVIGTLPTVVIGLAFHQIAETLFTSVALVGLALLVTGLLLWLTRILPSRNSVIGDFSLKMALIIGLVQGLAIIPGISRSGSTIATGLFLGLSREMSARYSFLLCIPAICGAAILNLKGLSSAETLPLTVLMTGMAVACVSGYLALSLLVFIVKKGQLFAFAPYCWILGLVSLGLAFF